MQSYNEYYSNINKYKNEAIKLIDPQDGNDLTKFLAAKTKVKDGINEVLNQVAIHDTNNSLIEGLKALSKQENTQKFFETFKNRLEIENKKVSEYLNSERLEDKVKSKAPLDEIYEIIEEDSKNLSNEEKNIFNNKLCSLIYDAFDTILNNDLQTGYQLFEIFMEKVPDKESLNMDTKVFTTYYEVPGIKGKHVMINKIETLLKDNPNDNELNEISNDLKEYFKEPGNNTEDDGKEFTKVLNKKVKEVAIKENVSSFSDSNFVEKKLYNLSNDELLTFAKKNEIKNVELDKDINQDYIQLYNYAKENVFSQIETPNVYKFMESVNTPLIKAINEKNVSEVKSLFKKAKERETILKELLDGLRKHNKGKFYCDNNGDDRNPEKYPGWLFSDGEANSLLNEFLQLYNYEKLGVNIEEILNDPIKAFQKVNDISCEKGRFNNAFKGSFTEIIDRYYSGDENQCNDMFFENTDLELKYAMINFNRYAEIFASRDDKDKFAIFNNLNNYAYISTQYYEIVNNDITKILTNSNNSLFLNDILPNKMLLGDKFNLFKHGSLVNIGIGNPTKSEYEPEFNRIKYMKENMKIDELLNKAMNVNNEFKMHNMPDEDVQQKVNVSMTVFNKDIVEAVKEKTNDKNFAEYFKKTLNNQTLTPIQKNSYDTKVQFYKTVVDKKEKFTEETFKNTIQAIADLKQKYNNHNYFAQVFFTNLRAQNKMINNMIDELSNTIEIKKENIEAAVNMFASTNPNKEQLFNSKVNNIWNNVSESIFINQGLNNFNVETTKEETEVNEINSKEGADMNIDFSKNDDLKKEEADLQKQVFDSYGNNKQYIDNSKDKGSKQREIDKSFGGKEY